MGEAFAHISNYPKEVKGFFFFFLSICQVLRNKRKHAFSLSYILNSNYPDLFKKNQCVHAVYWAFDEVLRMLKQNIVYALKELSFNKDTFQ